MTRLDELITLRRQLDLAIEREQKSLWAMAHLRDELESALADHPAPVAEVMGCVASTCGVSVADLLGRSRQEHITDARHILAWLLRDQGMSFPDVGRVLRRDHTTVMHSVRRVAGSADLGLLADRIRSKVQHAQEAVAS